MRARFSLVAVFTLGALSGCDLAFGLTGQPEPCELTSFKHASAKTINAAESYSVDWDQTYAVFSENGTNWEMDLPDGTPRQIDLGIYQNIAFALTPEANALFYTASAEPMVLKGALRSSDYWELDAEVPLGTFAGSPSADVFGPRRVLVRLRPDDTVVQEFEDQFGRWVAVGEPLEVTGPRAPSLTPDGLTMVYAGFDTAGTPGIVAAARATVDEPFGKPLVLRYGDFVSPQLCGRCQQLYAIDNENHVLVRFNR